MRSIVYAGNDFSDICSAEVVARSANPIIAEYMRVPGRAGALLVTGYIPPVDVTVRLSEGKYHLAEDWERQALQEALQGPEEPQEGYGGVQGYADFLKAKNGPEEPQEGLERHEGIQGYIEYHRAEQADLGPQRPRRGQREER